MLLLGLQYLAQHDMERAGHKALARGVEGHVDTRVCNAKGLCCLLGALSLGSRKLPLALQPQRLTVIMLQAQYLC